VVVGVSSCNAPNACEFIGSSGETGEIGIHSCNREFACEREGGPGFGPTSIGNFSCNQSGPYNDECTDSSGAVAPPVGDCMYNDPVTTAQEIACVFVGVPGFGSLAGVLQSILAIFSIF
jgi:hypothetical protein